MSANVNICFDSIMIIFATTGLAKLSLLIKSQFFSQIYLSHPLICRHVSEYEIESLRIMHKIGSISMS